MGVVEAIKSALGSLPQQSVTLRYLLSGAGDISISDVDLAAASGACLAMPVTRVLWVAGCGKAWDGIECSASTAAAAGVIMI